MIIAQQVQGSVQSELAELTKLAMSEVRALTFGGVDRDEDFAEKAPARRELVSVGE